MATFNFTAANDPLFVNGTTVSPVSSLVGSLNTNNSGTTLTGATGSVSVAAFGAIPATTYTSFTTSQTTNPATGVITYSIVGTGGTFLNPTQIRITYTSVNPSAVNVVVGTDLGGVFVPVLANTSAPVCFVAGTLIRTSRGEVPVESLRVGDMVETTSGKSRRVVWLGSSDIDIRLRHDQQAVQPIRIAADAFGPGMPHSDLTVSPGHALCVRMLDEVLVPACVLINGSTVTRLDEDHVTYWHVELEAHEVLYANGLPSESYIDVGNRTFFIDGDGDVDPQRTPAVLANYCRPYVAEGALVQAMRAQLNLRAEKLGWRLEASASAELHLMADGARVEPVMDGMTARFDLPAGVREVWLVSNASVPAHVSDSADRRELGVRLQGLRIGSRKIAIDDPALCVGFHGVEGTGADIQRWTAASARLPASLWAGARGDVAIALELVGPALPRWIAPAARDAEPKRDGSHLSLVAAA